jgi:hypothetical protein
MDLDSFLVSLLWRAEILSASMDRSQDNDVRCQSDTREVLWKVRRSKPKGG